MSCTLNWWNLPIQIKEKLSVNLQYNWQRLPIELNTLLRQYEQSAPDCYSQYFEAGKKLVWFTLPSDIEKLCNLINCVEQPPYPINYNFDITANWTLTIGGNGLSSPITDQTTFESWLTNGFDVFMTNQNDLTDITVTDFDKTGDRIRCVLSANGNVLVFSGLEITDVKGVGNILGLLNLFLDGNQITEFNPSIALPNSLTYLFLNSNQITEFNPSIALPNSLTSLSLSGNQITEFNPSIALPTALIELYLDSNLLTTASYLLSETWATSQPAFVNICEVLFESNINSVSGTTLETILISKNCTVTP